ncbi:MAG: mechanosensitive ion channel family protein [Chloroflexota bacterium]|nr:mechanosensitive ion channel family protein [Chloroflexota bacterium]
MSPTVTPIPYFGLFGGSPDPLVQLLLNVIRGLGVLVIALILARYSKRWTVLLFTRSRVNLNLATLLGNIAQVAVVVIGVVLMLPFFGVEPGTLWTLLGVGGLALSLSMQDLLKNVIAGIYILLEQPFRIGDRISVKEVTGVVQGIELRTTILRTDENLQVVAPNSMVLNEIVTNRSASDLQRQILTLRVPNVDITDTGQAITEVLKGFDQVAGSPTPVVALESVQSGVARLRVEFWVPSGMRVSLTPHIVEALQTRFPSANVVVAS